MFPGKQMSRLSQDLVICRALVEIFSDKFLADRLAFRGGTALHKLYLEPQPRYSEDIDLVQITLPLRGFLICPHCGKLLTGSASKGARKYYSYYHCFDGCTCRFRADGNNNLFVYELKKYIPKPELIDVYKVVLTQAWNGQFGSMQDDRTKLLTQIKELEGKISYIRDLLSSRQIDPADFREMKSDYILINWKDWKPN